MKKINDFQKFLNENIYSIEPEPGPGTYGTIRLANLHDEDIDEIHEDPITSEWLESGRITLVDNKLWVDEGDTEVIGFFNDNFGFEMGFDDFPVDEDEDED